MNQDLESLRTQAETLYDAEKISGNNRPAFRGSIGQYNVQKHYQNLISFPDLMISLFDLISQK